MLNFPSHNMKLTLSILFVIIITAVCQKHDAWLHKFRIYCTTSNLNYATVQQSNEWQNCSFYSIRETKLFNFPNKETLFKLALRLGLDVHNQILPIMPPNILELHSNTTRLTLPSLQMVADNIDERLRIVLQEVEILSPAHLFWKSTVFHSLIFNPAITRTKHDNHILMAYRSANINSRVLLRWLDGKTFASNDSWAFYGITPQKSVSFLKSFLDNMISEDPRLLTLSNGTIVVSYVTYISPNRWAAMAFYTLNLDEKTQTANVKVSYCTIHS